MLKGFDMATRSTGRSSKPDKPVNDKTTAFEHRDGQHHREEEIRDILVINNDHVSTKE